jgi:lipopolysaccharide export LptBFGC system permease protein LptF
VNESTPPPRRSPSRSPRRQSPWLRRLAVVALALIVFALGIALGQALNDGPPPPSTATYVRTLEPLP